MLQQTYEAINNSTLDDRKRVDLFKYSLKCIMETQSVLSDQSFLNQITNVYHGLGNNNNNHQANTHKAKTRKPHRRKPNIKQRLRRHNRPKIYTEFIPQPEKQRIRVPTRARSPRPEPPVVITEIFGQEYANNLRQRRPHNDYKNKFFYLTLFSNRLQPEWVPKHVVKDSPAYREWRWKAARTNFEPLPEAPVPKPVTAKIPKKRRSRLRPDPRPWWAVAHRLHPAHGPDFVGCRDCDRWFAMLRREGIEPW